MTRHTQNGTTLAVACRLKRGRALEPKMATDVGSFHQVPRQFPLPERVTTTSDVKIFTLGLSGTTVGSPPAADRRAREPQRAFLLKYLVVVTLSGKPNKYLLRICSRNGTPWHARKVAQQLRNLMFSPHQPIFAQKLLNMLSYRNRSCSVVVQLSWIPQKQLAV